MRTYSHFLVYCREFPPFREGVDPFKLRPHIIWAELRPSDLEIWHLWARAVGKRRFGVG